MRDGFFFDIFENDTSNLGFFDPYNNGHKSSSDGKDTKKEIWHEFQTNLITKQCMKCYSEFK